VSLVGSSEPLVQRPLSSRGCSALYFPSAPNRGVRSAAAAPGANPSSARASSPVLIPAPTNRLSVCACCSGSIASSPTGVECQIVLRQTNPHDLIEHAFRIISLRYGLFVRGLQTQLYVAGEKCGGRVHTLERGALRLAIPRLTRLAAPAFQLVLTHRRQRLKH